MLCEQAVAMANSLLDQSGKQLVKVAAVCGQKGWPIRQNFILSGMLFPENWFLCFQVTWITICHAHLMVEESKPGFTIYMNMRPLCLAKVMSEIKLQFERASHEAHELTDRVQSNQLCS